MRETVRNLPVGSIILRDRCRYIMPSTPRARSAIDLNFSMRSNFFQEKIAGLTIKVFTKIYQIFHWPGFALNLHIMMRKKGYTRFMNNFLIILANYCKILE